MRKTIVAINVTLDGFCDHTAGIADEELHDYYADILSKVNTSIMGRVTYKMMEEYWPDVARNKTGTAAEIRFAENLERLEKFVISNTLTSVEWDRSTIISDDVINWVRNFKNQDGGDILIGGPSIISLLASEDLIDEYYLAIQPIVLGNGIRLFKDQNAQLNLDLLNLKRFDSGVISAHYIVKKETTK